VDAAVTAEGIAVRPLQVGELYRPTDLSNLQFSTTAELQPLDGLVGQARAFEAIQFGIQAEKAGFNLSVIGPHGARMQDAVKAVLGDEAREKPSPSDGSMSTISWTPPARLPLSFLPAAPANSRRRCTN